MLDDHFPDHSIVYGCFRVPALLPPHFYWHFPAELPWSDISHSAWHEADASLTDGIQWTGDLKKSNHVEVFLTSLASLALVQATSKVAILASPQKNC